MGRETYLIKRPFSSPDLQKPFTFFCRIELKGFGKGGQHEK